MVVGALFRGTSEHLKAPPNISTREPFVASHPQPANAHHTVLNPPARQKPENSHGTAFSRSSYPQSSSSCPLWEPWTGLSQAPRPSPSNPSVAIIEFPPVGLDQYHFTRRGMKPRSGHRCPLELCTFCSWRCQIQLLPIDTCSNM